MRKWLIAFALLAPFAFLAGAYVLPYPVGVYQAWASRSAVEEPAPLQMVNTTIIDKSPRRDELRVVLYDPETEQRLGPMSRQRADELRDLFPHGEIVTLNRFGAYEVHLPDRSVDLSPPAIASREPPDKP